MYIAKIPAGAIAQGLRIELFELTALSRRLAAARAMEPEILYATPQRQAPEPRLDVESVFEQN
jgi:hypothetical protein